MLSIGKHMDASGLLSAYKRLARQSMLMDLGTLIRAGRNEAGLSQRALAKLVGVSPGAVAHWESNDSRPTVDKMGELKRILGIKVAVEPSPGTPYAGQLVEDPDELALLAFWRSLDRDGRTHLVKLLHIGENGLRAVG